MVDELGSVSPLELFFDLVFVFAFIRVTDLMAEHPTGENLLRGALVIAVLWWSWVGYVWLCNLVRADEGILRVAMFGAMAAMFVTALTSTEAFDDLPGGLFGPVVFAVAYFAVRLLHVLTFWVVSREDPQLRGQVHRFVPGMLIGTTFLLIASQLTGTAQTVLWILALVGDSVGTLVGGTGWRLRSIGQFTERHGLIVIIALGESIVSIGIDFTSSPISWASVVAALLGLIVAGLLWWLYFDVTSLAVEQVFADSTGRRRIRIARNCYSFLHLPMVVGIVMLSLGLKKIVSSVGHADRDPLTDSLQGWPLIALLGGAALYLLALVAFKAYATGSVAQTRVVAALVLMASTPLISHIAALAALGCLAVFLLAMTSYETVRYNQPRNAIRHGH
ncbi:low temperature requirement protein A [Nocardia sp. CA-107356]|uniref:low temperature requirement protein A n=1 Tax=Nocardia sp. CA-107356 TaxID=3239972 RepID=UPI003D8F2048